MAAASMGTGTPGAACRNALQAAFLDETGAPMPDFTALYLTNAVLEALATYWEALADERGPPLPEPQAERIRLQADIFKRSGLALPDETIATQLAAFAHDMAELAECERRIAEAGEGA